MANYATTSQLIERFASDAEVLHVVDNAAGAIGDATTLARLTDALEDAEGIINGYLGKHYDVPIDVSSDTTRASALKRFTLDIAVFQLFVRSDHITEASRKIYDDVVSLLKDIAAGKAVLPAESAPAATEARSPIVSWGDNDADSDLSERVFTRSRQSRL